MSLATITLSVNDSETMKKPTHIIMWQDDNVSSIMSSLTARLDALEKLIITKEFRTPLISGIDMKRRSDSVDCMSAVLPTTLSSENVFKELLSVPIDLKVIHITPRMSFMHTPYSPSDESHSIYPMKLFPSDESPSISDMKMDVEEEYIEVKEEESVKEESVEVQEEEESVEVEEEGESLELEEFEYKGITYYRDAESTVYQVDMNGDIDDTAIGVWNEDKQKVLKYAKA